MSKFKTYCPRCGRDTVHQQYTETSLGGRSVIGRVVFGVLSLGMNEALGVKYTECLSCGTTN